MTQEHSILQSVKLAQDDIHAADALIRAYQPFIRSEVSRFINRHAGENDDEVSIGMLAFHEAIQSYSKLKGSFLNFASLLIKNRLIDYVRHEKRHQGQVSLDRPISESGDDSLIDTIAGKSDSKELVRVEATKKEIEEFIEELSYFGLTLEDMSESSPKQKRTLDSCHEVIRFVNSNKNILNIIMETKKLPITLLVENTSISKKTLERHRKYVLSMVLVLTNGFDIMRGHLEKVIRKETHHHDLHGNGMLS